MLAVAIPALLFSVIMLKTMFDCCEKGESNYAESSKHRGAIKTSSVNEVTQRG